MLLPCPSHEEESKCNPDHEKNRKCHREQCPMQEKEELIPLFPSEVAKPNEARRPDQRPGIRVPSKDCWIQHRGTHSQSRDMAVARNEIGHQKRILPPSFNPLMRLGQVFSAKVEQVAIFHECG